MSEPLTPERRYATVYCGNTDKCSTENYGIGRCELHALRAQLADYVEQHNDVKRLTRDLDVAMHGEANAAPQASLCDLIALAKALRAQLEASEQEKAAFDEALAQSERAHLSAVTDLVVRLGGADARGYQRGREEILARIRALTPTYPVIVYSSEEGSASCSWCRATWDCISEEHRSKPIGSMHPANDCLWALAHADQETR